MDSTTSTPASDRLRIRLVQHALLRASPAANRDRIRALLGAEAHFGENALIILPELYSTGFVDDDYRPDALRISLEDRAFLSRLARDLGSHVLGSTLGHADRSYANLSLLFAPDGREIMAYQKIHPFTFGREDRHFSAGTELPLASLPGGILCPGICYDLRFPELFRAGAEAGATLFTVQANWPEARQEHWGVLCRARAIENQAFVAAVNCVGEQPPLRYLGGSVLLDPRGRVLAELPPGQEGVCSAEIEWSAVTRWRRAFSAFQDRKTASFWKSALPRPAAP